MGSLVSIILIDACGCLKGVNEMPSAMRGGRGRSAIPDWRVKAGKKEVFSNAVKFKCTIWIREHQKEYPVTLRLIPPNY
jgi:hypothetical protein